MPTATNFEAAERRRAYWINEIRALSGSFANDATRLATELRREIKAEGSKALMDHLRVCGAIPEEYPHDSSAEKLYSKYTDEVISLAFTHMGIQSLVLTERADAADVVANAGDYSFVADAKAFRLSRTAKNQKDFKIQAMDGWKRDSLHAIVVCPIYQLPSSTSQIYQQAIARDVCILTYSHLSVLVGLADMAQPNDSSKTLREILRCISTLNPSKDAMQYWLCVNRVMLGSHQDIGDLWREEKKASLASVAAAKREALSVLAHERVRIMSLSREEAIMELVRRNNVDGRIRAVEAVRDNGLLDIT